MPKTKAIDVRIIRRQSLEYSFDYVDEKAHRFELITLQSSMITANVGDLNKLKSFHFQQYSGRMCFVKLKLHSTHRSEYVYYTNLSMIQLFFGFMNQLVTQKDFC